MPDVNDRGFVRGSSPDGPLVVVGPDGVPLPVSITGGSGGGLTDAQLRAAAVVISDAATTNRFSGGKLAKTAQVTASGTTVVHTPAAGKAVRLFWVGAINDPDQTNSPRIRVGFTGAADYLYSGYAIAHWEIFTGAVDQTVQVDLDQAGDVAFTMHYQEV